MQTMPQDQHGELLARLEAVFADTFQDSGYEFSLLTTQDDVEDWDSLNQIRLLMATEMEFGFKFDLDEMEELTSVKALIDAISARQN
jgi:acyl carrier protein